MAPELKEKLLLLGALLLVLVIGFFAGRLSIKIDNLQEDTALQPVGQISTTVPTLNFTSFDKGVLYGKSNGKELRVFANDVPVESKTDGSFFIDTSTIPAAPLANNGEKYLFVASKNSTLYHPIGSSAANRISPKNKVYFVSKADAEQKGFKPGSDVK